MIIEAAFDFFISILRVFAVSFVMLIVLFIVACVVADIVDCIKKR